MATSTALPSRRGYFRFSLRTFCVMIVVFSVLLGAFSWRLNRARRQKAIREALWEDMRVRAEFPYYYEPHKKSWLQTRLEPYLGEDFFETVVGLDDYLHTDNPELFYRSFQDLPYLKSVSIDRIEPGRMQHLAGLIHLESLSLRGGAVNEEDLKVIGTLKRLDYLHLEVALPNGDLHHLHNLTNLGYLGFGEALTDEGLRKAGCTSALQGLSLKQCQITDDGLQILEQLPNLRNLDLYETRVTGQGMRHVSACAQLQNLNLERTLVDDDGLKHVGKCHELSELNLKLTKVTDAGLAHLSELTSLKKLTLDATAVTGSGLEPLVARVPLPHLNLRSQATKACLPPIQKLRRLDWLTLDSNDITAADLANTKWPTTLRYIRLSVNEVDEAALLSFARCSELQQIDIPYRGMSKATMNRVGKLLKCDIIDQTRLEGSSQESSFMPQPQ